MKGCSRRVGCLILIIALVAGWYWYTHLRTGSSTTSTSTTTGTTVAPANVGWQPLTQADAERGRKAVESLSQRSGPVFANLTAAEAASYIFLVVAKQLPPSAQRVESLIKGDRLYVRSEVDLKDLGGAGQLGTIGMILGSRDSVLLGGTIQMMKPGLAQFLIQEVKIGRLDIPEGLIPRLITQMKKRGKQVEGVAPNGLPMVMPSYISDVRIADGKITLYKSIR
jgi:hypothetical protein